MLGVLVCSQQHVRGRCRVKPSGWRVHLNESWLLGLDDGAVKALRKKERAYYLLVSKDAQGTFSRVEIWLFLC